MSYSIPHFIIGGTPRAGTGWMMSCLTEHKKVFIPNYEINYFNNESNFSSKWYLKKFEERLKGQVVGEKSPSYIYHPKAAQKIYEWNPNIKLVFSIRNPIDRTYSEYRMALRRGYVSSDIEDELTTDSPIVQHSLYFEHLQSYLEHFPEDQLSILIFDDLKADPGQFATDLFREVGVDPPSDELSILSQKFGRTKKRGGAAWNAIRDLSIWLSSTSPFARDIIQWLRRHGYTEWVHKLRPGKEDPPMTDDLRRELAAYYRDDVETLSSYLNRDLQHWLE